MLSFTRNAYVKAACGAVSGHVRSVAENVALT
jgi:hypothetical protein